MAAEVAAILLPPANPFWYVMPFVLKVIVCCPGTGGGLEGPRTVGAKLPGSGTVVERLRMCWGCMAVWAAMREASRLDMLAWFEGRLGSK